MQIQRSITLFFKFTLLLISALLISPLALADGIEVHHPKINPTVPGMSVTAAYFHLKNNTDKDIQLVKASSDISDRVEIHEHSMVDGLMKMQHVEQGITIPANSMVTLEPGGYHIMIMNLKNQVNEGDTVDLTLEFDNGMQKTISTSAERPSSDSHQHH